MAYSRDPFGMNRKAKKGMKSLDTIFGVGITLAKAAARQAREQQRAQARQQASAQRFLVQQERSRARQIRENEAAVRRAERERAKAERESERVAKLQAKLEEQQRFEAEVKDVENDNFIWTNLHTFINDVVTLSDVNTAIAKADSEQKNNVKNGLFKEAYPSESKSTQVAADEATQMFSVSKARRELDKATAEWSAACFEEDEPTLESIREQLSEESKVYVKEFLPWRKKSKREEYITERLEERYKIIHEEWEKRKSMSDQCKAAMEQKQKDLDSVTKARKDFIAQRGKELFEKEVVSWTEKRDDFYDAYRQVMQKVINGDKEYIIEAINTAFANDEYELPIDYFVDVAFDEANGRVMVDLDLPEIEDLPGRKISITSAGKKSIRTKSQTNLREDYVNCICGLSMYVAGLIFNVSLRIKEVEIMGFTQRQGGNAVMNFLRKKVFTGFSQKQVENTALTSDQYVLLVRYNRDVFEKIAFSKFSPLQILDFFKHYMDMTKSFVLKELDLETAFAKMDLFVPADYKRYISRNPS